MVRDIEICGTCDGIESICLSRTRDPLSLFLLWP